MSNVLTIRSPRFRMALFSWASNSRRLIDIPINQQLRLWVRDVIRITPPSSNYQLNRRAGENRIRKELNGIMRSSRAASAEDPAAVHRRYRRSRGRVTTDLRRGGKDRRIPVRNLRAYIATVLQRVGLLASGFAPAMQALGMAVPAWIARHGSGNGSYTNVEGFAGRRIRIVNRVPYASHVADLGRRVQHVTENRAIQMEKQTAEFLFRQAPRRAGFKVAA